MFHEPWWLDIVTRRRWTAAEVTEDGRTVAYGLSSGTSIRLYAGFGGQTSPRFVATRSLPSILLRSVRNRLGLDTFGAGV